MTSTLSAVKLKEVTWPQLEQNRRELFAEKVSLLSALSPLYKTLKETLLDVAGVDVVLLPDSDVEKLLAKGKPFYGQGIQLVSGEKSNCHVNSARVWRDNKSKRKIVSGYGLSPDGLWRQHTWVSEGIRILETTTARLAYWGYELKSLEAKAFAASELNRLAQAGATASPPSTFLPAGIIDVTSPVSDAVRDNIARMEANMETTLNGGETDTTLDLANRASKSMNSVATQWLKPGLICITDRDPPAGDLKDGHSAKRNRLYGELCKHLEDRGAKHENSLALPPRGSQSKDPAGLYVLHLFSNVTSALLSEALTAVFDSRTWRLNASATSHGCCSRCGSHVGRPPVAA